MRLFASGTWLGMGVSVSSRVALEHSASWPLHAHAAKALRFRSLSGMPAACPCSLDAPFQESADATVYIGRLEATGEEVAQWLAGQGPAVLSCIVPLPPDASDGGGSGAAAGSAAAAAGRQEAAAAGGEAAALGAPAGQAAAAAAAAAAAVAGLHIGSGGSRGRASQRADKDLQDELAAEARWAVGCRLLDAAVGAACTLRCCSSSGCRQISEHEAVCHGS